MLIAPFNDLATVAQVVDAHATRLAAIIVEPVQRALAPAPGFLAGLRGLCDRHGIALVFDEVVTGFRLAPGGAQERFGVVPDICALGKVLGGGLPLGAVAGRADLMGEMTPTGRLGAYVSGTLSANPLSCAAGLATLDVLAEPGAYDRLERAGETLRAGLRAALAEGGCTAAVLGIGSIFQVAFLAGTPTDHRGLALADAERGARFAGALLDRDILYTGAKGTSPSRTAPRRSSAPSPSRPRSRRRSPARRRLPDGAGRRRRPRAVASEEPREARDRARAGGLAHPSRRLVRR